MNNFSCKNLAQRSGDIKKYHVATTVTIFSYKYNFYEKHNWESQISNIYEQMALGSTCL